MVKVLVSHMDAQFLQHHFLKRFFLFLLNSFGTLVENHLIATFGSISRLSCAINLFIYPFVLIIIAL